MYPKWPSHGPKCSSAAPFFPIRLFRGAKKAMSFMPQNMPMMVPVMPLPVQAPVLFMKSKMSGGTIAA